MGFIISVPAKQAALPLHASIQRFFVLAIVISKWKAVFWIQAPVRAALLALSSAIKTPKIIMSLAWMVLGVLASGRALTGYGVNSEPLATAGKILSNGQKMPRFYLLAK